MSEEQFNLFLGASAWLCAAGAVLNLLLIRRRGVSAMLLAAAFLLLAATLLLLKSQASQAIIGASGVAVLVLLLADFAVRARNRESRR